MTSTPATASAFVRSPPAADFATRLRQSAHDPTTRVGLSLWCGLLAVARMPPAAGVHAEMIGDGDPTAHPTLTVQLRAGAQAPAITLEVPAQNALSDWFDARLDALAISRPGPLPQQLAGVACLLGLDDLLPDWPAPRADGWRGPDVLPLLSAAEHLQRWATPVFLHSVLGQIVSQLKAWSLSLPLTGASTANDVFAPTARSALEAAAALAPSGGGPCAMVIASADNNWRAAQRAHAIAAATARPAPAAPRVLTGVTPAAAEPAIGDAAPPSTTHKAKKKKNKKKKPADSDAHAVEKLAIKKKSADSVVRAVEGLASTWADAVQRKDKAAPAALSRLLGALLAIGDGDEAVATWNTCLSIAGRTSADVAWRLVNEARNELLIVPTPCIAQALLALGVPAGAQPCREAQESLWRLARSPAPLPPIDEDAERGLLALATSDTTRLPALCVAARLALRCGCEKTVPLSELAEAHRAPIAAEYARALRRDAEHVAGVLPLIAYAFGNLSVEAFAKHLLPLAEHGHLWDAAVATQLGTVLWLRPDVMAALPLADAPWRRVGQQVLSGFSPKMLDTLCTSDGTARHERLLRALGDAGHILRMASDAAPDACMTQLQILLTRDRSPLEIDVMLAMAGESLGQVVEHVGAATRAPTGGVLLPIDALDAWATLLRRIFHAEAGIATPGSQRGFGAAAHRARLTLRAAFVAQEHFMPWLVAFCDQHAERLTAEDERLQRRVLGPFITAVVDMLTYEPAGLPRAFLRACSQVPRLRDALTYALIEQWPTPVRTGSTGSVTAQICNQVDNLAHYDLSLPDKPQFFFYRFAMMRAVPLMLHFIEHTIRLSEALTDHSLSKDARDEATGRLWARTQVLLLGLAKRNTYWVLQQGEAVLEQFGAMFTGLPEATRQDFTQRFIALCRHTRRTAFFGPDDAAAQHFRPDTPASHVCIEHLLPAAVAICRGLPIAEAAALAHTFNELAQQKTDHFRSDTHCGFPKRLQVRIAAHLGPTIVAAAPIANDRDETPAAALHKLSRDWVSVVLPDAKDDGFDALGRLLEATHQRACARLTPSEAGRLVDDVFARAVAAHCGNHPLGSAHFHRLELAYLLKYLAGQPAWLCGRVPGEVAARIITYLLRPAAIPSDEGSPPADVAMADVPSLPDALAHADPRDVRALENQLVAGRLLARLLDNPRQESLQMRLEALLLPDAQHDEMVQNFRANASQVASVLCAGAAVDVADEVMRTAAARGQGSASPVAQALQPALQISAAWRADQANDIGAPPSPSR